LLFLSYDACAISRRTKGYKNGHRQRQNNKLCLLLLFLTGAAAAAEATVGELKFYEKNEIVLENMLRESHTRHAHMHVLTHIHRLL